MVSKNDQTKKQILVISGAPQSLVELKMELKDHFEVNIAADNDTALTALEVYNISAAVIYIGECREKAFSVFNSIFDLVHEKKIPIIFLAEQGNDDDETTAFKLGAVDYSTRRNGTLNALISRLSLRITASEYEKRIMNQEPSPDPSDIASEAHLENKRILVADDVEINRIMISGMLGEISGLTLDFAVDGNETVEMFKKYPASYSLILMDVQMPNMDGLEATRLIRSHDCDNAREIPIIAVTAGTRDDEIKQCLDAGMNDFIEKPIEYEKLIAVTAKYC